ncbi:MULTISPECIES: M20 metallopeptidase family protein [Paenibacillus]|jgi:amidohydrolase|uniref:Peptidase M20 n=1 Tax=Paenibacillus polymyxa (strain SC2) TaxID=886882 RepID=E3E7K9_PAEPS|nr:MULTISPECIES: M20 family metallopeptidase [Paenibacillus]ADO56814.1 peptidase M20 [Paenibacillus polymyxa SC2]PNQ85779.1 amidohydrolase [Paenibacillus polymyxa]RFT94648.1 amidohydrolase [Paenibacillus jamilae]WOZ36319.1 M20 family metallopeptidase [Paenibacillus polymyxa]WPQ54640.1 M20 family metallopeptidase [Paenibacillus polymyxa]
MLEKWVQELKDGEQELIAWRRYLHQHPELSFEETNTSAFIADQLRSFGIEVRTNVGGNGVLGFLEGGQPGRTIAFRADFDALPIQDEKDAPYKSTVPGVMHACGHDGHTAALLGVARVLSHHRETLKGKLVFIFQHAEEKPPGGAKFMIEDGCLDGVEAVYGIHLSSEIPLGKIGLKSGPAMAAADAFSIEINGKGGHGARPHQTVDSIVIGSQIVNGLQQVVSRRVDPTESAVLTIGVFQAGTAFNVIADKAKIEGTVRTFNKDIRKEVENEIRSIVKGLTDAYHAGYEIDYLNGYPALVNAEAETERVRELVSRLYGADAFMDLKPAMGAEDFAYYLEQRPGAFIIVGARNEDERTHFAHHHPRFDFDERALLISGHIFLALALEYLQ